MARPADMPHAHGQLSGHSAHSSLAFELVRPAASGEPRPPRGARALCGGAALFLLAFLVTAHGVRALVPWPRAMGMDVHLNVFVEHKDDYQAVYLGPSTVFRSFRPEIIDPIVSKAGQPFRSFNLGFGGMPGHEQNFYLRTLVELNPRQLRWIVAEPNEFVIDATMFNLFSEREVFWHDLETTIEVLRGIDRIYPSWERRAALWRGHLEAWAWRQSNLGQGPRIVEAMLRRELEGDAIEEQLLLREGGYQDEYDLFANRHRQLPPDFRYPELDLDVFQENLRTLEARSQLSFDLERFDLPAFLEQRAIVEGSGRELIYVVPPLTTPIPYVTALRAQGALTPLLSFHGAASFPLLYQLRDRIDAAHLNERGAGLFSELVGERLAALWGARAEGPR